MTNFLDEFEQTPKSSIFQNNVASATMLHVMGIASFAAVFLFFLDKHESTIGDKMKDAAIGIGGIAIGYIFQLLFQKTPVPMLLGLYWFIFWMIKMSFFN